MIRRESQPAWDDAGGKSVRKRGRTRVSGPRTVRSVRSDAEDVRTRRRWWKARWCPDRGTPRGKLVLLPATHRGCQEDRCVSRDVAVIHDSRGSDCRALRGTARHRRRLHGGRAVHRVSMPFHRLATAGMTMRDVHGHTEAWTESIGGQADGEDHGRPTGYRSARRTCPDRSRAADRDMLHAVGGSSGGVGLSMHCDVSAVWLARAMPTPLERVGSREGHSKRPDASSTFRSQLLTAVRLSLPATPLLHPRPLPSARSLT